MMAEIESNKLETPIPTNKDVNKMLFSGIVSLYESSRSSFDAKKPQYEEILGKIAVVEQPLIVASFLVKKTPAGDAPKIVRDDWVGSKLALLYISWGAETNVPLGILAMRKAGKKMGPEFWGRMILMEMAGYPGIDYLTFNLNDGELVEFDESISPKDFFAAQ
jgi:hypothetical protein